MVRWKNQGFCGSRSEPTFMVRNQLGSWSKRAPLVHPIGGMANLNQLNTGRKPPHVAMYVMYMCQIVVSETHTNTQCTLFLIQTLITPKE